MLYENSLIPNRTGSRMNKCPRCKREMIGFGYCKSCREENYIERAKRRQNRDMSKLNGSLIGAFKEVQGKAKGLITKKEGESFRCSFSHSLRDNAGESKQHTYLKFDRWYRNRWLGRLVFVELELKDGSRPDLIIACRDGSVFIEEIGITEGQESFTKKFIKYPWPMKIIRSEK